MLNLITLTKFIGVLYCKNLNFLIGFNKIKFYNLFINIFNKNVIQEWIKNNKKGDTSE